jgi:AcrR family transcriptional regulator
MAADGDDRPGLRERKKRATRTALSRAAIRLGIERGWHNVTIEDIAAAADVSVRTFRNYFSSKAEAIAAAHVDRMLRIADAVRAGPAGEPLWDLVADAVEAQFSPGPRGVGRGAGRDAERAGRSAGRSALPEGDRRQGEDRWAPAPGPERLAGTRLMVTEPALRGEILKAGAGAQTALAEAVAERTGTDVDRDVYPTLVAAVIAAAIAVAVEHWLRADPPVPLGPLLRDVFDRLTTGLPPPAP